MPVIVCPNCRERMSVERGDLGERVVCPDCDHRFTARADPADGGDERGDDGRRPVRGRDADRDYDPPQKKGKSNSLLWIILALVSVFIVLPCLGCVGVLIYFNTAKASFPATWGDHSVDAVEGGAAPVTAAFPVAPVGGLLKDAVNGGSGASLSFNNIQQTGELTDATFLIGYVEYPTGTANPLEKGHLAVRADVVERHMYNPLVTPQVVSESSATVAGYPAKEARYAKDAGDFTLRVIHVNDRPKDAPARLVVVLAGGTGLGEPDKQKFLNSVKIGKGK